MDMKWIETMNEAMQYIEDHLEDRIDMKELAQIAQCSEFHFQRMFSTMVDVSCSEYIRRRRLSLAAEELRHTDIRIIDCALKYGYESSDAFSKAFSRWHHINPSQARHQDSIIKTYPRISFMIQIKGGTAMNYRFEKKEAFKVYGVSRPILKDDNLYELIPKFWNEIQENDTYLSLCKVFNQKPYSSFSLMGAFYDEFIHQEHHRRYLIVSTITPVQHEFKDLETYDVPQGEWVVFSETFEHSDDATEKIQSMWKRVFIEWFPTSNVEAISGVSMEVFSPDSKTCEIWIPIQRKN
jgi:AraC family transcriptional regulator